MIMEISKSVALLTSLANESRLQVFRLLVRAGPAGLNPSVIAQRLEVPAATLSFHLKELYQAGLIHKQRQGRSLIYSANYATMANLIDYLQENCCADDADSNCQTTGAS